MGRKNLEETQGLSHIVGTGVFIASPTLKRIVGQRTERLEENQESVGSSRLRTQTYFWKEEVAHFVQHCPEIVADNCENDHWILISGDLGQRIWGCRLRSGSEEVQLPLFIARHFTMEEKEDGVPLSSCPIGGAGRLGVVSS